MLAAGSYGYYALTDGRHALIDYLYMTLITVSTVGFSEHIPMDSDALKAWTMALILLGGASLLYFLTSLAAYLIEGDLAYGIWRRRRLARVTALRGHVVVAGSNADAVHAAAEVARSRAPLLVVAADSEPIERLVVALGEAMLFIIGDPTDAAILRGARLEHALGLVAALPDDRDNLMLCVAARQLVPDLAIAARVLDAANVGTFEAVGVRAIVEPARLGGVRTAELILHPRVVAFSEAMLASDARRRRLVELPIAVGSEVDGVSLDAAGFGERAGCLVMGVRPPDHRDYVYAPSPRTHLSGGGAVVALARPKELRRLRRLVSRPGSRPGAVRPAEPLHERAHPATARPAERGEYVVIGCGAVGRRALLALAREGARCVAIDADPAALEGLAPEADGGPRRILGDATDRQVLALAALEAAEAVAIVLNADRDNLFLCLLARHANPALRIVARADDPEGRGRLLAAGADAVVAPAALGGERLAHELLRPGLAAFSDALLASHARTASLRSFTVGRQSALAGLALRDARIAERTGCAVLGVRRGPEGPYLYHPPPDHRLRAGGTIMALGEPAELASLAALVAARPGELPG
ncbi:MAG: potassium channel protein [Deltaproteobacteria bacterium]|nr:potassium channel protein [Deltaproteobacteria bacterium]